MPRHAACLHHVAGGLEGLDRIRRPSRREQRLPDRPQGPHLADRAPGALCDLETLLGAGHGLMRLAGRLCQLRVDGEAPADGLRLVELPELLHAGLEIAQRILRETHVDLAQAQAHAGPRHDRHLVPIDADAQVAATELEGRLRAAGGALQVTGVQLRVGEDRQRLDP